MVNKKTTHTIQDVEGLMQEQFKIMENPNATKEEKRNARRCILHYERHINGVNGKHINGKKYPERLKGLPDDVPMNKKLLNDLIDSVNTNTQLWKAPEPDNLSGVYTKGALEEQ